MGERSEFRGRGWGYSTSLAWLLLGSFLMTGRGWASVLNTQCSNGRRSSSENNRYKYLREREREREMEGGEEREGMGRVEERQKDKQTE